MNENNLIEILNYIDPSSCDYTTWTMVGMALKHEGYSAIDWDNWSSRDSHVSIPENVKESGLRLKVALTL